MKAPQIIIIALYSISLLITAYYHGKPQTGNYSIWIKLISVGMYTGILWWGGFFG